MNMLTNTKRLIRALPAIFALALGGCVVAPLDPYGYSEETIIVAPSHRAEYRGYPPSAGYIWIDGYWNRAGQRRDWVGGRWAPPPHRHRAPERRWERERDHEHERNAVRDRSRHQHQQLQQHDADYSRFSRTYRERSTADSSERTRATTERKKWRERSRDRDDDNDDGRPRRGSSGWRDDAR